MHPAVKKCGFENCEYVLCYVNNVLCISDNPERTMKAIESYFKFKNNKAVEPKMYLGAELSKITNQNGEEFWPMSSEKYCTAAVENVVEHLSKKAMKLPKKCVAPTKCGYCLVRAQSVCPGPPIFFMGPGAPCF